MSSSAGRTHDSRFSPFKADREAFRLFAPVHLLEVIKWCDVFDVRRQVLSQAPQRWRSPRRTPLVMLAWTGRLTARFRPDVIPRG